MNWYHGYTEMMLGLMIYQKVISVTIGGTARNNNFLCLMQLLIWRAQCILSLSGVTIASTMNHMRSLL